MFERFGFKVVMSEGNSLGVWTTWDVLHTKPSQVILQGYLVAVSTLLVPLKFFTTPLNPEPLKAFIPSNPS